MAEELADDAVGRSTHLKDMSFQSAGTFACEETPASPEATQVMAEIGLDIERHRAQQFDRELALWADIILAMEARHIEEMVAMAPDQENKMHTLLGFAEGIDGYPGETGYDIMDPYREPVIEYRSARDQIKDAVERSLKRMEKEAK
jgi:protein-tyrosine phosphatase